MAFCLPITTLQKMEKTTPQQQLSSMFASSILGGSPDHCRQLPLSTSPLLLPSITLPGLTHTSLLSTTPTGPSLLSLPDISLISKMTTPPPIVPGTALLTADSPLLKLGLSSEVVSGLMSTPSASPPLPVKSEQMPVPPPPPPPPQQEPDKDQLQGNNLNGQLEINKQLMTCLSVALEEIKELRKQLSAKESTPETPPFSFTGISLPSTMEARTPPAPTVSSTSNVIYPSPVSIASLLKLQSADALAALSPSPETVQWSSPFSESALGSNKRQRNTDTKLKSNVPAACRSIVKNVYRELVRREAILPFDLHQGQESNHNVQVYWQVIGHIKKTTTNCVWDESDMLYAIRTYWRSLRDDRQRELSGKKNNHRRMIIRREIMKRKLKSRQKAIHLVSWSSEKKSMMEETLTLDYMSSEEEDNSVESREGPRPRVVRRLPWSSDTLTQFKADLDFEFKKICSARQLKATAHVYRRDHVTSSRVKPSHCPPWAYDASWVPEPTPAKTEESCDQVKMSPSMLVRSPAALSPQLSSDLLTTLRSEPPPASLPASAPTDVTMSLPQPLPSAPLPPPPANSSEDLLASLSAGDKALFESVVNTLAESNPLVRQMNPVDVIMSLTAPETLLDQTKAGEEAVQGSNMEVDPMQTDTVKTAES